MVEVQYSRCFSRLASLKARFYNAAPAALERRVQEEQKVNSQVRTSEASFMSVRKRLGPTSGGGGGINRARLSLLLSTARHYISTRLSPARCEACIGSDAISASLGGREKPYQPGLITDLLSEWSSEVESSGLGQTDVSANE